VIVAIAVAYRLALAVTMLPQGPLAPAAVQVAATVLAYPLVVAATRFLFGLRKPATGEVDALGRRL
jgi:rod shape-determining protein MreD